VFAELIITRSVDSAVSVTQSELHPQVTKKQSKKSGVPQKMIKKQKFSDKFNVCAHMSAHNAHIRARVMNSTYFAWLHVP
jgi:hypothetical protein